MRFHRALDDVLGSPSGVRLLRMLVRFPTKEFTGRELARLADVSPTRAGDNLAVFLAHGLVQRRSAGTSHLWRLVPGHALAAGLRQAFRAESASLTRLQQVVLRGLAGVEAERVVLFGSVARGDERPDSDVDLLVVVRTAADKEEARKALLEVGRYVAAVFGNSLSALIYTRREAAALEGSELMASVRRDGIDLWGGRT